MPEQNAEQNATIRGTVHYREGDGPELKIPEGRVKMHPAGDSMALSWTTPDGSAGQAALTPEQYRQYVEDGRIVPDEGTGQAPRT
ncbi:hypothetical protein [Melaminivora sp.]|uniref:hypothetical protein n=1 Tax=Melaminivora sp. TaxID=1933032 RepID=UPI0028A6FBE4|nr:hypothetical protein [Melaminivora sp.]